MKINKKDLQIYRNLMRYCPFKGTITMTKLAETPNFSAKVMVIGEQMFHKEVRDGKFFDSTGGRLLKATLKHVGIPIEDIYFTTLFK